MSIELKQYNQSNVAPKDDARLNKLNINESGVVSGGEVTHLGSNQLQIASGWGLIQGRQFTITQETINATVSDVGTKKGRLIAKIDTSNPTTPISFETQMAATLPALVQEDINDDGSVYELALAEYDIDTVAISNLVSVVNQINGKVKTDGIEDGAVTTDKLGTIEEITMASGDKILYNAANNTFELSVSGCTTVQLCPVVFGTSENPPAGTFPKGTLYLTYEP